MKKLIALALCMTLASSAFAGISSDKAAYRGGTVAGLAEGKEAKLDLSNADALRFKTKGYTLVVPYAQVQTIEYGQKAGRRIGAAVATTILVSPIGLAMLLSKKRKHMVTLSWLNAEGKTDAAVFELGKDAIRPALATLEARTGKQVEYETPEAKANIGK